MFLIVNLMFVLCVFLISLVLGGNEIIILELNFNFLSYFRNYLFDFWKLIFKIKYLNYLEILISNEIKYSIEFIFFF